MPVNQNEIQRLSENEKERIRTLQEMKSEFHQIPDKYAVLADLHRLIDDEESEVRWDAACTLIYIFSSVPDEYKCIAWDDLIKLTHDLKPHISGKAASNLVSAFSSLPDECKSAAWIDLVKLTDDNDLYVRESAFSVLINAFSSVPDEYKPKAWADLIRFSGHEDSRFRWMAFSALDSAFACVPDECKSAAWADLIRLTRDRFLDVRGETSTVLGSAFVFVSDKSAAWADLVRLASDKDSKVRKYAADTLIYTFGHVPDDCKSDARYDLQRLTSEGDPDVRIHLNHSLGKMCIDKAYKSINEEDFRTFLKDAICYFEKAAKDSSSFTPSLCCNLFYRAFHAVIFKEAHSNNEIKDYITAAKKEIEGSKSKQKLVAVIEQLATVLEIASNNQGSNNGWRELLKRGSNICNHVDKMMG